MPATEELDGDLFPRALITEVFLADFLLHSALAVASARVPPGWMQLRRPAACNGDPDEGAVDLRETKGVIISIASIIIIIIGIITIITIIIIIIIIVKIIAILLTLLI